MSEAASSWTGRSAAAWTGVVAAACAVSDYGADDCAGGCLLAQGVAYAEALSARLAMLDVPFRIVLSRQPEGGHVTVRFFVRRTGTPYFSEEPDDYPQQEVAYWDV